MNGEPLPPKHGCPMRALALDWTGTNCVKCLHKISVMDRPFRGFFMDKVYRVFQKEEDSEEGTVVTRLNVKSVITQPIQDERLNELKN
jgi:DMSO/TMAO reductase YedYZ molybdopterin-dependent catalytic subunit